MPLDQIEDQAQLRPRTMTMDELEWRVRILSSQMFVRHFLWLNHPQHPQLMALQFAEWEDGRIVITLGGPHLEKTLEADGFRWNLETQMWTIQRR